MDVTMPTVDDVRGVPYTVDDAQNLEAFSQVMDAYLASKADTMDKLDSLVAQNVMPMATCFRGYLLKMGSNPTLNNAIQKCLDQLQTAELNNRERAHVAALNAWFRHQNDEALQHLEALLEDYPRDMLALRVAHHLHFYTGDAKAMTASVERRLPAWSEDDPYFGYVLGMQSFGLEESAEYREASLVGRRACELNPDDIWAGHAMAHVFQMDSRWLDGLNWMDTMLPQWTDTNNFLRHLHWHKALYHIGRMELDAALAVYDDVLEPGLQDDFYLDTCNAASLLWRLNMQGLETPDRWQKIHDLSVHHIEDGELVFCSLHYLMAPAVLNDQQEIKRALLNFESWRQQSTHQGRVANEVGATLANAIVDLASGRSELGASALAKVRGDVKLIGGSWAQRQLFKDLQAHHQ
jgi:tetratricopeptide (TPR) repeat protein